MIGIIQNKKFTQSGAPLFTIGGQTYFVGRACEPKDFAPGTTVEFEWQEFGDDRGRGRPKAIQKWCVAQEQGYALGPAQNTQNAANPQLTAAITDYNLLQSVSNIVGRIGQAGLIKTPEELDKWITACWQGLKRAPRLRMQTEASEKPPQNPDDFDDDIPF